SISPLATAFFPRTMPILPLPRIRVGSRTTRGSSVRLKPTTTRSRYFSRRPGRRRPRRASTMDSGWPGPATRYSTGPLANRGTPRITSAPTETGTSTSRSIGWRPADLFSRPRRRRPVYRSLGEGRLTSGERLELGVVETPDPSWSDRIVPFLLHKGGDWNHHIAAALERPLDDLETRFYVGTVDGQLVTQV